MSMKRWKKLGLFTLGLVLTVTGCEAPSGGLEILSPTTVSEVRAPKAKLKKVKAGKAANHAKARVVVERIGAEGGVLVLGEHRLTVPAGAVEAPVVFRMRRAENGFVEVELTATRAVSNDVGAKGFRRPLVLELGYAGMEAQVDASAMVIAWVREDGELEPLRSIVDHDRGSVSAELTHFSAYTLAIPK